MRRAPAGAEVARGQPRVASALVWALVVGLTLALGSD